VIWIPALVTALAEGRINKRKHETVLIEVPARKTRQLHL
jgi:hypothetical protein